MPQGEQHPANAREPRISGNLPARDRLAASVGTERPVRVLIADDHRMIVDLLMRHFRQEGCEVIGETDPDQVRALTIATRPDLAVVDAQMPPRERFYVLRELMRITAAERPAVMVLSGHDEPAIRNLALDLGAAGFLTKPWDPEDLRELTNTLISQLKERQSSADEHTAYSRRG